MCFARFCVIVVPVWQDDGAVVYMNGVEVARVNMPAGAIAQSTLASKAVVTSPFPVVTATLPPSSILVGNNVLAVEVHTSSLTAPTMRFDMQIVGVDVPSPTPSAVPTPVITNVNVITKLSTWKFLANGENLATVLPTWNTLTYNDALWASGVGPLGWGPNWGGAGTTTIPTANTVYFRNTFTIPFKARVQSLRGNLRRADGAVCYLNGVEIYRSNMPTGTITGATLASTPATGAATLSYLGFDVSAANLVDGRNVVACEVHQVRRRCCGGCLACAPRALVTVVCRPTTVSPPLTAVCCGMRLAGAS